MHHEQLSRRKVLAASALAGIGAAVGGLTLGPGRASAGIDAGLDLAGLGRALKGQLLRPGDDGYAAAATPWNAALPARRPAAIINVADRQDVVTSVKRLAGRGVPLAARSGGHNYAGYSTPDRGVIVDVTRLNAIKVCDDGTAVVGSGARLIDVYSALAAHGRALPSGTCSTIGIAGITMGGGIGVLTRRYGLTLDHVAAATVVTADGSLHRVDDNHDADLFWALRGGGGGNAGVVTDFTFRTVPAPTITTFDLDFPDGMAADVLAAWSAWNDALPDELTPGCSVGGGDPVGAHVSGAWIGIPSELDGHLGDLIAAVGAQPTSRTVATMNYLDAMKYYADCADQTVTGCHLDTTPGGTVPREAFHAASRMLSHTVRTSDAAAVVDIMRGRDDMVLLFDGFGGAAGRVGVTETAFPHRSAHSSVQIYSWDPDSATAVTDVQQALTAPVGSGSYVNYVNPGQPDWARSYWGANRDRLRSVVRRYDPQGAFRFPQSVLNS